MLTARTTALALSIAVAAAACKKDDGDDSPSAEESDRTSETAKGAAEETMVDHAAKAEELARRFVVIDTHVDAPYRMQGSRDESGAVTVDLATETEGHDFDYPRAKQGGLDAPFMSIYIPARYQDEGGAKELADQLIDMVEGMAEAAPDKFAAARSVADVVENFEAGLISLPMGIENGAAIEKDLANLQHFYDRGIRYITLTHAEDNAICDSSYADTRTHEGLSDFGEQVVAEMNRLGIMVDISHVSDAAFHEVMAITEAPVIASHSSARHFTPGFERNMSDEMIKKVAESGGVVMINFGSSFVLDAARKNYEQGSAAYEAFKKEHGWDGKSDGELDDAAKEQLKSFREQWKTDNPFPFADVETVADHIDHVVDLVGIDHVGLGSDFDGVGDSLPTGLKDVSMYPNLFRVLLERGYTEEDIEKLAGKNLMRVWKAVEAAAGAKKI